jgi:hypothetical protein
LVTVGVLGSEIGAFQTSLCLGTPAASIRTCTGLTAGLLGTGTYFEGFFEGFGEEERDD